MLQKIRFLDGIGLDPPAASVSRPCFRWFSWFTAVVHAKVAIRTMEHGHPHYSTYAIAVAIFHLIYHLLYSLGLLAALSGAPGRSWALFRFLGLSWPVWAVRSYDVHIVYHSTELSADCLADSVVLSNFWFPDKRDFVVFFGMMISWPFRFTARLSTNSRCGFCGVLKFWCPHISQHWGAFNNHHVVFGFLIPTSPRSKVWSLRFSVHTLNDGSCKFKVRRLMRKTYGFEVFSDPMLKFNRGSPHLPLLSPLPPLRDGCCAVPLSQTAREETPNTQESSSQGWDPSTREKKDFSTSWNYIDSTDAKWDGCTIKLKKWKVLPRRLRWKRSQLGKLPGEDGAARRETWAKRQTFKKKELLVERLEDTLLPTKNENMEECKWWRNLTQTETNSQLESSKCKQYTSPRASFTCHTCNFSRVHVAQVLEPSCGQDRWVVVLSFLKSHCISSFVHRAMMHSCPHFSPTSFPTQAPRPTTSPSLLYLSASPSAVPLQGGLRFGRLAEQSPLTGYEPESLIEVSSEHTPINLLSRERQPRTNLRISRPLWMRLKSTARRTWDGWLLHFSQECEVSAIPFGASCSQTHSSTEKSVRKVESFPSVDPHSSFERSMRNVDRFSSVELFSSFGKPLSKGKRIRYLESMQDSQMERERILSESGDFHDILQKKSDQAFQGDFAAQRRLSEAQFELDRREWRMRNADIALYDEAGMQLHPRG